MQPITLDFYNKADEVEKTFSRNRVPTYLLDMAISITKEVEVNAASQEAIDAVLGFVIEFYKNEFTLEELKEKTDLGECMSILGQVLARAGTMAKQFALGNPTPPSSKRR